MSALRKILSLGMIFPKGDGWEIHPLSSNVFVALFGTKVFLSDGERYLEETSFASAVGHRTAFRRLTYGEPLK